MKKINEIVDYVNQSLYPTVKFRDNVVGNSVPTKDKINPSLLADIQKAAEIAKVKPVITTAVSGHRNAGRHPYGNAVDIAMFSDKGFSSESDAKSKGIYEDIIKFVNALVSMGYLKNKESGNDKSVLTFGFPEHDNHVHVSRNSGGSESPVNSNISTPEKSTTDSVTPETSLTGSDIFRAFGAPLIGSQNESKNDKKTEKLINEINKIKKLLK